jgi:hypothetical protein
MVEQLSAQKVVWLWKKLKKTKLKLRFDFRLEV